MFLLEQAACLFTHLFEEDSHFGVGGFNVNGKLIMTQPPAGHGADRGDDGAPEGLTEGLDFVCDPEHVYDVIDLNGTGKADHGDVSVQHAAKRLVQWCHVVGKGPSVDGHGGHGCSALHQARDEVLIRQTVFLYADVQAAETFRFEGIKCVKNVLPRVRFGNDEVRFHTQFF